MWLKRIVFYSVFLVLTLGHIPDHITTPSNKIDQYCSLADSCIHDTIPICGMMGDDARTFLDVCDLLEFACDTGNIYSHVDDTANCPNPKKKKSS